jgi:hypothetical protein
LKGNETTYRKKEKASEAAWESLPEGIRFQAGWKERRGEEREEIEFLLPPGKKGYFSILA